MCEYTVALRSFADVQNFVKILHTHPFAIQIGSDSHWVNGKSLFGMFTLNYRLPMFVRADCPPEQEAAFRQSIAAYLSE